ncbi:M36 family metallopeptidase [Lentzea alba]|uniref:M36 family metallopeptidase n=1 Tax=Lentzea alba TaxID=2714351 RepID=UPI0039BF03D9
MLRSSRSRIALYAVTGAAIFALAPVPAYSAPAPTIADDRSTADFDVRKSAPTRPDNVLTMTSALGLLQTELGIQGRVDIDQLTGTPRLLARTDGFLTGPSALPPREIVLNYLRERQGVVGLSATDLPKLSLRKDYVDVAGTHHLSFVQQVGDVPLFGNGLKAHVSKDGRLIQLDGSPVRDLPSSLGLSTLSAPDKASKKVAFYTGDAVRPAWSTVVHPKPDEMRLEVVDAGTGKLLYRKNLVQRHDDEDVKGLAWEAWAGKQREVNLSGRGWLPVGAKTLDGNVAHVVADANGDVTAQPDEEIPAKADGSFKYRFTDFTPTVGAPCNATYQCTWNPKDKDSWKVNRNQNAVQAFAYIGNFHDHLAAFPIGFTRAAGNFEKIDGDAVNAYTMIGAGSAQTPYNNAFMGTPPDGQAPTMGMFLFHNPADPQDPWVPGNAGDSASTVYHEYVHGLSNRLVVDANGVSTLDTMQSGAMGEGWSDWYGHDYLVQKKLEKDTSAPGEIVDGGELSFGKNGFRSQPIDCPVGATTPNCPGTPGAGPGGYTYGDFGKVAGRPAVHPDSEIWSETLWDLRSALGVTLTRSLVTRAMEFSPASPSFLDMRNSILQADTVVNGGQAHKKIWQVFAKRGMGFFAAAITGADVEPVEDFSTPPPAGTPTGTLSGRITDAGNGTPAQGVAVRIAGHDSGFAGGKSAVTGPDGRYTITDVIPGTYAKVYAFGAGYEAANRPISVRSGANTVDWSLRRNWATSTTGAVVTASNGDDWSSAGCGPADLLRQTPLGSGGWSTDRKLDPDGTPQPRFVTIKLGKSVDVSAIEIDPAGSCGDDGTAGAKDVTVDTSVDGATWVAAGKAAFTPADQGKLTAVPLSAGRDDVLYVRLTVLANQVSLHPEVQCDDPAKLAAGCFYTDVAGLAVRGS